MEPGLLRHKVDIERVLDDQTARGGPVTDYVPFLSDIWAEVLHLTPREQWQAQQIASEINMKVRIRYRPGLDAKMRVKWQRQPGSPTLYEYMDVDGPPIEVEGRRDEVWLMCIRRDAEGFRTGTT